MSPPTFLTSVVQKIRRRGYDIGAFTVALDSGPRSRTMEWSRREVLGSVVAFGAVTAAARQSAAPGSQSKPRQRPVDEPFGYCLNTSTIRGNQLGIVGVVEAAAKAGF